MKNFAFYVSGNATRVKLFLKNNCSDTLKKQIKFILIDNLKNSELKELSENLDIPFYEYNITNIDMKNKYISDVFLKYLETANVDVGFIFADKILEGNLLNKYENRLVNFHPSLLPSFKGLSAIDKALDKKAFLLGNTAHFIVKEVDNGPIIMQNIYPSKQFKNYNDILNKQVLMLIQLMVWFNNDRIQVKNKVVTVIQASYEVEEFIPNIELEIQLEIGNKYAK